MKQLSWRSNRRFQLIASGVALLMVFGVGWWWQHFEPLGSTPEKTAETYLTALRDGDMETALDFMWDPDRPSLHEVPYSAEWDFEVFDAGEVFEKSEHGDVFEFIHVPYEISFAGGTSEGVFAFRPSTPDSIENPLARVSLEEMPIDYVDFGGPISDEVMYFPGVYEAYTGESELFDVVPGSQILTTDHDDGPRVGEVSETDLRFESELTETGAETITSEAQAWLEECMPDVATISNCRTDEFEADALLEYGAWSMGEHGKIERRVFEYLEWEIVELPDFVLSQEGDELEAGTGNEGLANIEVTLRDGETLSSQECDINLDHVELVISDVDEIEFKAHKRMFDCD